MSELREKGMNIELYATLGVPKDATPEQIKAAHRAKVRQHHPDAGGDPETFRKIQQAYDVLSDPELRERYDQTGSTDTMDRAARREAVAREQFSTILMSLVEAVDDPWIFEKDQIAFIAANMKDQRKKFEQNLADLERQKAHIEKLAARFKPKHEDAIRNIPRDVFAHSLQQLERAKAQVEDKLAIMDIIEVIIAEYEFEKDEKPVVHQVNAYQQRETGFGMFGKGTP